jgi:hypothetical protein
MSTLNSAPEGRARNWLVARGMTLIAADRPHGDRIRYRAGCRCTECRRANTQYEIARAAARRAGDWNGIVSAEKARAHIEQLSLAGVGYRQVADASGVPISIVQGIKRGNRTRCRALTERAILAVTPQATADGALVDARPTWKLLNELVRTGYTKSKLAAELGLQAPALQIGRRQCTLRNAYDVQRLYERLRRVPHGPTTRLIAELRSEGYRQARIEQLVREFAARHGLPAPDLTVHAAGFIDASTADLVRRLHAELLEVPV